MNPRSCVARSLARQFSRPVRALAIVALALPFFVGCSSGLPKGIEPVTNFDADRYLGTWYEIARLDHFFERGMQEVSTTYSKRDDGTLQVVNRGWLVDDGKWKIAKAQARFRKEPDIGWLEVSFFGPLYSDYIVFELADDYSEAWVSGSDKDSLWLLSRAPVVSAARLAAFREKAAALGYDVDALIIVDQEAAEVAPPE